ncbi:hypothetical protein ACW7EJ_05315, partial [Acinetobacter soli]
RLVKFEAALDSPRESFQYLDLSKSANVSATILNKALQGKGILSGQAQAFIFERSKYWNDSRGESRAASNFTRRGSTWFKISDSVANRHVLSKTRSDSPVFRLYEIK